MDKNNLKTFHIGADRWKFGFYVLEKLKTYFMKSKWTSCAKGCSEGDIG
jgi:hypothetical protein